MSISNALPTGVPNVWGEGILFGFSGADGQTVTANGFVGSLGPDRYSVLIHTPVKRILSVSVKTTGRVMCATGDAVVVDFEDSELAYVWSKWHTLIGVCPDKVELALGIIGKTAAVAKDQPIISTGMDAADGIIVLLRKGNRFSLSYGVSSQQALDRCQSAISDDVSVTIQNRLAYLDSLPKLDNSTDSMLLRKAASVSKVNILASEGAHQRKWSTPDRVPHRNMWLWDSVFHSFFQNLLDPDLSYELIRSVADFAYTAEAAEEVGHPEWTGKLAHQMDVAGKRSLPTQPPLLAWAFAENAIARGNTEGLEEVVPILEGYLQWDMEFRDSNRNRLLEWKITNNPGGHCDECGLDNSPRFDVVEPLDTPDFSALLANDALALADLCERIGDSVRAERWRLHGSEISEAIQKLLWDEESGFYYDRRLSGELTGIKAITGFLPLILPNVPSERVERCVEMLFSEHFDTTWPVATVARSEPTFSNDMWRGPVWLNMNYMVWEGMRRQGKKAAAEFIQEKTLEMIRKYYQKCGVLFEFYDALDEVEPLRCLRKGQLIEGPYLNSRGISNIRDYHFTAAITGMFLLES